MAEESDDEVNKDLLLLAMQQEKLLAELRQAYAQEEEEDTDERRAKINAEMEAKMKAINAGRHVSRDAIMKTRRLFASKILSCNVIELSDRGF